MSGNDDKKGKVESLSFHPVMLRLDRGILKIGDDGRGITRSSRVMTERGKLGIIAERGKCRGIMAKRGKCQVMTIRKGKLVITTKEKSR